MSIDINQDSLDKLIDDVRYLQDEAEALKYVIDSVPYDRETPSGTSIVERLLFLDHTQQNYYRPIIEEVFKSPRPINLNAIKSAEDSFTLDEEKAKDIQKVLYKIAKHRVAILSVIEKIPVIEWERELKDGSLSINLFDFVERMVNGERKILKNIADLILTYQKDAEQQREINSRGKARL